MMPAQSTLHRDHADHVPIQVLFVTTQWPTPDYPNRAPFVAREVDALRDAGIPVEVFVYSGGWNPPRYLKAVRQIRKMVREGEYSLVHARFGQCGIVALSQRKLPVIVMYGGSDVQDPPQRVYWKRKFMSGVRWIVSNLADEVIVVSDHLGKLLSRKDYHVVSSVLDMDLFKPMNNVECREKLGLPLDKKLALFAAFDVHNERKRYPLAVAAIELVKQDFDIELVALTGKPAEEVAMYMNACDLLLLTSTNEGSPNVVKEALACNLPVVSTDVGDVRSRIGGIEGCVVCESDTPSAIAEGIKTALRHEGTIDGRSTVAELSKEAFVQKVLSVYKKALTA